MHLAYFLLASMLLISPQCALAVTTRQQQDADRKAVVKQALIAVAKNAYLNYNKNVQSMKYQRQGAAATRERILELERKTFQLQAKRAMLNRYELRDTNDMVKLTQRAQDLRRVKQKLAERRSNQKEKMLRHKSAWSEASQAAGSQFSTNRLLHATMPKDVKAAQNDPKKALQLVAENAGKLFGTRLKEAQTYAKFHDHAAKELSKLHGQYKFHCSDTTGKTRSPLEKYHTALHREYVLTHGMGRKATSEARQHLWTNRMLHLTVKGIDPIKLPEPMFKRLTKGGRNRPYQTWWDVIEENPPQ